MLGGVAPLQADTVWMNSMPKSLPCGVVHAWTEDYLGIAPGSNQIYRIEYYHWYPSDRGRLQGDSRGGLKTDIDAALASDDAPLKNWIKRTMTADIVGDYRDGVLLADGEQCPGLGEGGFPDWH
jgi:hypothetical protein